MPTVHEHQQKFMEMLLTMGSLLAVLLGFVADKSSSSFQPGVILLGVLFIVSSLYAYTDFLFGHRTNPPSWLSSLIFVTKGLVATSFALLVTVGVALGLTLGTPTPSVVIGLVGAVVLATSLYSAYSIILRVLLIPPEDESKFTRTEA
jgi:hypothetical protein